MEMLREGLEHVGSGAARVNREVPEGGRQVAPGGHESRLRQPCPRMNAGARPESGPCLVLTGKGRACRVTTQCQFLGLGNGDGRTLGNSVWPGVSFHQMAAALTSGQVSFPEATDPPKPVSLMQAGFSSRSHFTGITNWRNCELIKLNTTHGHCFILVVWSSGTPEISSLEGDQ